MGERPVLLDTNILSTFAKIGNLEFLFRYTGREVLYISTNVFNEIEEADYLGYLFVEPVMKMIGEESLSVLSMKENEFKWCMSLPPSFGKGERDSLAMCKFRNGIFLTNERKIINFCDNESIPALDLPTIFRHSWRKGLLTKDEVRAMIRLIEEKDNVTFKNISNIFKE